MTMASYHLLISTKFTPPLSMLMIVSVLVLVMLVLVLVTLVMVVLMLKCVVAAGHP